MYVDLMTWGKQNPSISKINRIYTTDLLHLEHWSVPEVHFVGLCHKLHFGRYMSCIKLPCSISRCHCLI